VFSEGDPFPYASITLEYYFIALTYIVMLVVGVDGFEILTVNLKIF
jgi:hypothetical protein